MSIAIELERSEPALPPLTVEPVKRPALTQRWSDVVFLHWRYDPVVVQRLLPPGVRVDTYDGSAWVALVPFRMERLRIPVARVGYRLPYCYGRVEHNRYGDGVASRVDRRWPRPRPAMGIGSTSTAAARIEIDIGPEIEAGDPLTRFLTDRWGLISSSPRGALRYAAVDHGPWPLFAGELIDLDENLIRAAGLPRPDGQPQVLWSPGVDVRVGFPTRIRPSLMETS